MSAISQNIEETMNSSVGAEEIDPITFSVVLNKFNAIAKEMTLTLEHTAWTSTLALARDISCAIYDHEARQGCMADVPPIHFFNRSPRRRFP